MIRISESDCTVELDRTQVEGVWEGHLHVRGIITHSKTFHGPEDQAVQSAVRWLKKMIKNGGGYAQAKVLEPHR